MQNSEFVRQCVVDGKQVSVWQQGAGEHLVMLHGYLSKKESFYYQIKEFSAQYRVTAFDFVGMGDSAPLTEAWSVSDYARHTLHILDALGIEKCRLLAHSFGGRVALKLLAGSGERVCRALLTGCAGVPPRRGLSYKLRVKAYRAVRAVAPGFAEKHFGSPEYRALSPVMRQSFKKIVGEDLTPLLSAVRVPVLYVFGDQDTATPPFMAETLKAGTPGAGLVYMKGGSHFCFCERPQEFNAVAREFFR